MAMLPKNKMTLELLDELDAEMDDYEARSYAENKMKPKAVTVAQESVTVEPTPEDDESLIKKMTPVNKRDPNKGYMDPSRNEQLRQLDDNHPPRGQFGKSKKG